LKRLIKFIRKTGAESLRWTMGFYCAAIGAFLLVAPHQFSSPAYEGLRPYLPWWGMGALASGVALLGVAILRPRRAVMAAAHGLAALTFLALALSYVKTARWPGIIVYTTIALGLAAGGFLPRPPLRIAETDRERRGHDLFALMMGFVGVLQGVAFLAFPQILAAPAFDAVRHYWLSCGLALFLGGTLLLAVQLRPRLARRYHWAAHFLAGAAFVMFGATFSAPRRAWTGLALYVGCGFAVALLPWLSRRFAAHDPSALRTRLAFALATATSVALVLTAAVATHQEEQLAIAQVLDIQRIEAQAIARNVADYVQLNGARASVMAALAARLPMRPGIQRALLDSSRASYPDVTAFVTLDAAGTVLATTGGLPLDIGNWRLIARDLRSERERHLQIRLAGSEARPELLLSAPIERSDRSLAGVLVTAFDSERLARRIARPGSSVWLADGYGRIIARWEESEIELPGLPAHWDQELRQGRVPELASRIAAFARVPGLDWVVAVEKPQAAALAGVRRGRELAFALLLLVVPLAVAGGIIVARRIARPLGTLSDAVDELTAGNPAAPLETSGISEVQRLAAAFLEMRGRLAERTQESERLAGELRARADALAESDRRKDEFLAMLSHELRNPLGAISNASYLLQQVSPGDAPLQRAAAVIQRQIQHLVRLVDDLLDVSRITRGKIELRRRSLDLREVVRSALETTRPVVEAKQHHLTVELPPEPLSVHADGTRLEQVFGNLIRNAAKYTEPGGRIEISAFQENGSAHVRVRDNGIGIPPELLPRIFDLFIQGEQGLDRSAGGLGIGLTLVRRLIELHGGQVEARSEGPGKGSEIVVRLSIAS